MRPASWATWVIRVAGALALLGPSVVLGAPTTKEHKIKSIKITSPYRVCKDGVSFWKFNNSKGITRVEVSRDGEVVFMTQGNPGLNVTYPSSKALNVGEIIVMSLYDDKGGVASSKPVRVLSGSCYSGFPEGKLPENVELSTTKPLNSAEPTPVDPMTSLKPNAVKTGSRLPPSTTSSSISVTNTDTSTPTSTGTDTVQGNSKATQSKAGVSPGVIAGIVLGVLAVILVIIIILLLIRHRRRTAVDSHISAFYSPETLPTRQPAAAAPEPQMRSVTSEAMSPDDYPLSGYADSGSGSHQNDIPGESHYQSFAYRSDSPAAEDQLLSPGSWEDHSHLIYDDPEGQPEASSSRRRM